MEKIIEKSINDIISESFLDYAREVIENRALPDVRDGLKPVQRRILFVMKELGLFSDRPHRKCARIVGDTLGKLHPHGDLSVYNALVNLAQPFGKRYPLIDGQGNFGTIDDGAAAMRYTEARLSLLAMEMIKELDKDTTKWQNNFDDTLQEPTVFPSMIPNLLINGSSGIAVGIATNIPPHNLGDTVDAICAYIDNESITARQLAEIIKGPDFPTGGIISPDGIFQCYEQGVGTIAIRSRVTIEELPGNKQQIVVKEIPYQVSKAALLQKIIKYAENTECGIDDIRDESDKSGIRIVIETDKSYGAEVILEELFKKTEMQVNYNCNIIALIDSKPKTLSLKEIIEELVKHKKNVVARKTRFELSEALAKQHILEGLIKAISVIDEIIAIIRKSSSVKTAKVVILQDFGFSIMQVQAILDIRLQKLTAMEIGTLKKESGRLAKIIKEKTNILKSEKTILAQVRLELEEIKKTFADNRKTTIEKFDQIQMKAGIERFTLQITEKGKIKKLSEKYIGENTLKTDSVKTILAFSEKGSVLKFTGDTLKDLPFKILNICNEDSYHDEDSVVFVTSDGKIKKSAFLEYKNLKSAARALIIDAGAKVIGVFFSPKDAPRDFILLTKFGYIICFEDDIRQTGRMSLGVQGISLDRGDEVVSAWLLNEALQNIPLSISSLKKQKRNGKGNKANI